MKYTVTRISDDTVLGTIECEEDVEEILAALDEAHFIDEVFEDLDPYEDILPGVNDEWRVYHSDVLLLRLDVVHSTDNDTSDEDEEDEEYDNEDDDPDEEE